MAFTIFAILVGVSLAAYVFGNFLQLLAQGAIERTLGVRRMHRDIDQLYNHTIVCGYGRVGKTLSEELAGRKVPFVVVEHEAEIVADAADTGYLFLTGDATDEDMLLEAGVKRASSLIVALRSDADNVFLTLTARNLNPRLRIIARGEQPATEKKLLQAGADRVVMPAVLGARRMAAMVSHPHAAELIDLVTDHRALNAVLEELQVPEESPWAGKSIRDAGTRSKHHLLIVALRRADGGMVFNPEADLVVQRRRHRDRDGQERRPAKLPPRISALMRRDGLRSRGFLRQAVTMRWKRSVAVLRVGGQQDAQNAAGTHE